jgi:ferredoxin
MRIAGDSRRIYTQETMTRKKVLLTRRSKMGKKVVIDADECIGCESCVELCPDIFVFNEEEEKAEVIMPEGGPEDCIEEAMDTCPVECIHWEED